MKYKKQSLKKKYRHRRHRFSKKYSQHGGGFMDAIASINVTEGRTNTCMAVHPTQPLVAVGDDAGTVTLWEINPAQPKRVAQLMGLSQTVKCVEFHQTFPVVAAACSDMVLMWRIDQINREQQDQRIEPSHTVSDFRARSEDVVRKEYDEAEQILEEERRNNERVETEIETLRSRNLQITGEIEKLAPNIKDYETFMHNHNMRGEPDQAKKYEDELKDLKPRLLKLQEEIKSIEEQLKTLDARKKELNIWGKEKILNEKASEIQKIQKGERDEVSCFSFYTGPPRESYIAVGVNNNKQNNQIIMYQFRIEPSSSMKLHSLPLFFKSEGSFPQSEKVLFTSFSSDGQLFSFVTKKLDGTTVLKVINFKGPYNRYQECEYTIYEIRKKCAITCITPYRTNVGYHNGSFYKFAGIMHTHGFIIGCDDGSLMLIDAVTINISSGPAQRITRVEAVRKSKEWNVGEAIECVSVHPSLPLFASGSRNAVQLWDVDERETKPLAVQPEITPVISVGFNENYFTACGRGPGGVRVYSCNANDYRGFKEELKKELKSGTEIAKYGTELVLAGRQGERCSICNEPMNDPLTQPLLRSGVPSDAEEVYLGCGHKFHKGCITTWIKQGKPCPLCRADSGLAQATPQRIIKGRKELQDLQRQQGTRVVAENLVDRFGRYEPHGLKGAAAASSAPEAVAVVEPLAPEPPASAELTPEQLRAARLADIERRRKEQSENSGGGKRNKYSRKKYSSKKLKFRRRYSNKK